MIVTSHESEGEDVISTDSPIVHSEDMSNGHSTLQHIWYRKRHGKVSTLSNPVKRYGITAFFYVLNLFAIEKKGSRKPF